MLRKLILLAITSGLASRLYKQYRNKQRTPDNPPTPYPKSPDGGLENQF